MKYYGNLSSYRGISKDEMQTIQAELVKIDEELEKLEEKMSRYDSSNAHGFCCHKIDADCYQRLAGL